MSDRKRLMTTEESEEQDKFLACIETSLESTVQTSLKWKEEERRWKKSMSGFDWKDLSFMERCLF